MMRPKEIAIAILSKRKKGKDEDEGAEYETAASNVLSAVQEKDSAALAESLREFVEMCRGD